MLELLGIQKAALLEKGPKLFVGHAAGVEKAWSHRTNHIIGQTFLQVVGECVELDAVARSRGGSGDGGGTDRSDVPTHAGRSTIRESELHGIENGPHRKNDGVALGEEAGTGRVDVEDQRS